MLRVIISETDVFEQVEAPRTRHCVGFLCVDTQTCY